MLKHVVMWKFKDHAEGSAKDANLLTAKSLLDALPASIAEIRSFEVGIDTIQTESSFDLILTSSFENREALTAYQNHADHVNVVAFLRKVQSAKVVVDYVV